MGSVGVEGFKSALTESARANRFEVTGFGLGLELHFFAKAASLPQATIGDLSVPYQGRTIKLAGDRVYPDFTMTVYQEKNAAIRKAFEIWMVSINGHIGNSGAAIHGDYKREGEIEQMGRQGEKIQKFKLFGAVPIDLGPVTMAWDSNDTASEFDLTLSYDYFKIS